LLNDETGFPLSQPTQELVGAQVLIRNPQISGFHVAQDLGQDLGQERPGLCPCVWARYDIEDQLERRIKDQQ
jgi:hypothetical protein